MFQTGTISFHTTFTELDPVMAFSIEVLRTKLAAAEVDFTVHALFEAASDLIFVDEIERALPVGEIIEYVSDRNRCVVLCHISRNEPIHVVIEFEDWATNPSNSVVVITVYRPDPVKWIDSRMRRE